MDQYHFCTAGKTQALTYAISKLTLAGVSFLPAPDKRVTHLLLPIPSFNSDGTLKGGIAVEPILEALPPNVVLIGGHLNQPCLEGYTKWDLLQNDSYLAENAGITAHCAVKLALSHLPITLQSCPVLITGWGRIGKCLADLLKKMGASVTVSARKASDRAMLKALGYTTLDFTAAAEQISTYRIIFNTVPMMVLPESITTHCHPDCLKVELASLPGIGGYGIIDGRGLPNRAAPESSGALIADTVMKFMKGATI